MNERSKKARFGLASTVAVLIVALAWLAAAPQVSAQDETVAVGDLSISPGNQGQVTLDALDIDPPGVGAWAIDIVYDPAVVSPVSCVSHESGFCNPSFSANSIRATGAAATGLQGDTTLASITFSCDQEDASTNLAVVVRELVDATVGDPQPIAAEVEHGSISCTPAAPPTGLLGDVDCNETVNSIDAALVLQFGADLVSVLPCPENADVNGDGDINSLDALLILQLDAGLIDEF